MNTENPLTLTLEEARLPGRILSVKESIGSTLADLCGKTAYDLSRLKGVGDSVIDDLRLVLSFYKLALSGDTVQDYDGDQHPLNASYRSRLEVNYPGMADKLGTASDREVGEQFGVSAQSINNHRRMLGIERAVRTTRLGVKDALIARFKTAITEALAALSEKDGPLAITILEAALVTATSNDSDDSDDDGESTDDEASAKSDDEASDDDGDDDDGDDGDESDNESDNDGDNEQAAAPTEGAESVKFDFDDEDFNTDDEDDGQPGLTFS